MTIECKFNIGDRVKNRLNDEGIITIASKNESEQIMYWIDLPQGRGSWEHERHLTKVE